MCAVPTMRAIGREEVASPRVYRSGRRSSRIPGLAASAGWVCVGGALMPMKTHTLRRWGAVLLTGGLCLGAAYLLYPSDAHSSLIRPAATLGLVGLLLALPGLVAYQRG